MTLTPRGGIAMEVASLALAARIPLKPRSTFLYTGADAEGVTRVPLQHPQEKSADPGDRNAAMSRVELPTITFAADGCALGIWRKVTVAVWTVQMTLELIAELEKLLKLAAGRYSTFSSVHLVRGSVRLPPADGRAALKDLTKRYGGRIVCRATMLDESGFWATAIRGIVTSLHVFEGRETRTRFFDDVHKLSDWAAPVHSVVTDDPVTPADLRRTLQWMLDRPSVRPR